MTNQNRPNELHAPDPMSVARSQVTLGEIVGLTRSYGRGVDLIDVVRPLDPGWRQMIREAGQALIHAANAADEDDAAAAVERGTQLTTSTEGP